MTSLDPAVIDQVIILTQGSNKRSYSALRHLLQKLGPAVHLKSDLSDAKDHQCMTMPHQVKGWLLRARRQVRLSLLSAFIPFLSIFSSLPRFY